jgi:hypothetical protein
MKNISGQYQELLEGKMTQAQFLRNARAMFPNYVTNHNSFQDSVTILKQKGMLVEGDAVKGTPDKTPEYDYPTQPGKYKKVVQEPEVDEQDGIYPATTLTDIPKEEVSKPIKSKTRPDGLEDIKNNDTKNEMKKVKVVKEGIHNAARSVAKDDIKAYAIQQRKLDNAARKGISDDLPSDNNTVGPSHVINKDSNRLNRVLKREYPDLEENQKSFDDVLKDFIETDDSTEIKAYLKAKGKEAIAKIKTKLPQLKDQARQKLAKLMKIELDEIRTNTETQMNEAKIAPDAQAVITLLSKQPMILQKISLINNKEELQPVFDFLLTKINPGFSKGTAQIRTATNQTLTAREKTKPTMTVNERLKPAITKLVQEVLDEMGQE